MAETRRWTTGYWTTFSLRKQREYDERVARERYKMVEHMKNAMKQEMEVADIAVTEVDGVQEFSAALPNKAKTVKH